MIKMPWLRKREGRRGQALVEFVIALPILLFVLFGIIEFARLTFAWMSVQNAARFGIRYAVTGDFNETYCVAAGNNLGADHINADVFGGDPRDCVVPTNYTGSDGDVKERELIDLARLFSIRDAAVGGGTGLWLEPAVSGSYEQFLDTHNIAFIGMTGEKGFFHTTVCSNRSNQFVVDYNNYAIPLCVDTIGGVLMDDAGGPGDRVKVHIEHQHPLFLPILTNIWPSVPLSAERDGIVEKFRTSRVMGVSGPILSAPTWTQTPTITPTPTTTPTVTPSLTPTVTETPIPIQCDLIEVVTNYVGHWSGGYHIASVTIRNNNPVPIHLVSANQNWVKNVPNRELWAMRFNNSPWDVLNDENPATIWNPSPQIEMDASGLGDYIALFDPENVGLEGDTSMVLEFDDNCYKGVTVDMPTATASLTPTVTNTPTLTPTPDCSQYSLSPFEFRNYAIQRLNIVNNDVVDARLVSIELDWAFAEAFGAANGYSSLNVDWYKYRGSYMPGHGQGGTRYYSSPTIWNGDLAFNAGTTNRWEIDFDNDWGGGGPLTGVISSDFGVRAVFDNGCVLERPAVPRPIITWTPSPTPSVTPTPTPPPPPTATSPPTMTPLPTNTLPPSNTPTASNTPTITPTSSATPIPSHTPWPTSTPVPTNTPNAAMQTATASSWTSTPSPTSNATNTPKPTYDPDA
jgi:hypothetical protein